MWLLGNRKDDGSSSKGKKKGGRIRKNSASMNSDSMHLAETYSGIEVSLSADAASSKHDSISAAPTESSLSTVLSLKDHVNDLQRLFSKQFAPTLNASASALPKPPPNFRPRKHRVPLFRRSHAPSPSPQEELRILATQQLVQEGHLLRQELQKMDQEIHALQQDRDDLESIRQTPHSNTHTHSPFQLHRLLATAKLTNDQRKQLQTQRGTSLTLLLPSKARETIMARCGSKSSTSPLRKSPTARKETVTLVAPHNCRDGGAAATIQHVQLLSTPESFYISRDNGKAFFNGNNILPDRLAHRLKKRSKASNDILYLAAGNGYYYVEFRNGDIWWGSPNDAEFDSLCSSWNVHRVELGPATRLDSSASTKRVPSWIILSQDAKVAWKNVPSRLQHALSERDESSPAVCSVALGAASSYFVRWADGTTDWQLPCQASEIMRRLEADGPVLDVSLHPEQPQYFIIRH